MVKIQFKEPDTSEWKDWRQKCEKETEKLIKSVKQGLKPKIAGLYKKRIIKDTVYIAINGPFSGKCAYCETRIASDQYGDMEHYRPVKAVEDENGNPINIENENGEIVPHPGYYWLAYYWKNLLPSCIKCNRPNPGDKKIGKHNRFPVKDNFYCTAPGQECYEKPLLINPLFEDPEEHLEVNLQTGVMGGDERGKCCIDIFGLNVRPGLLEDRKTAYMAVLALLNKYISSNDESEERECIKELSEIIAGRQPYSLVGRTLIKKKFPGFFE